MLEKVQQRIVNFQLKVERERWLAIQITYCKGFIDSWCEHRLYLQSHQQDEHVRGPEKMGLGRGGGDSGAARDPPRAPPGPRLRLRRWLRETGHRKVGGNFATSNWLWQTQISEMEGSIRNLCQNAFAEDIFHVFLSEAEWLFLYWSKKDNQFYKAGDTIPFPFINNSIMSRFVTGGGPSVDKLMPGDQILSINGEDVARWDLSPPD